MDLTSSQQPVLWIQGENDPEHESNLLIWVDPTPGAPARSAVFCSHEREKFWFVYDDDAFCGYESGAGTVVCEAIYFIPFPEWPRREPTLGELDEELDELVRTQSDDRLLALAGAGVAAAHELVERRRAVRAN